MQIITRFFALFKRQTIEPHTADTILVHRYDLTTDLTTVEAVTR